MTNSHIKQSPFVGYAGFGGGAPGLSYKSAATKKYIDEVFSTNLWAGTSGSLAIDNGIDLEGEGGLVWMKMRNTTYGHGLYDTVRGTTKELISNSLAAENTEANGITAFNSNGFTTGSRHNQVTECNAWSFRKAKGFFDIITYTGTGSAHTKSHSLGCVPGCIIVKKISSGANWRVYHREVGVAKGLKLNGSDAAYTSSGYWNDTLPTSTEFTIGTSGECNDYAADYVAYLFAGGASTASGSISVNFSSGSSSKLSLASSSDFGYGTGDFTWEAWIRCDSGTWKSNSNIIWHGTGNWDGGIYVTYSGSSPVLRYITDNANIDVEAPTNTALYVKQWYHVAVSRSSGTTRIFKDGTEIMSVSDNFDYPAANLDIGNKTASSGYEFDGQISNVRIIKGTALYTSSFIPPTEPLTNVTNTVLLCCQSSTVTAATVSPGTITENSCTSTSHTPFDDPAAFVFGEDKDKGVLKCGSYRGTGATNLEVSLGFEAQYLLIKNTDRASTGWQIFDSMRGIVTGGDDALLTADSNSVEGTNHDYLDITSDGFRIITTSDVVNYDGDTYIYMAIRRPDTLVGKPAEAGTDVFTTATGNGSGVEPAFTSGFPVDFAFGRQPASTEDWYVWARFMQGKYLKTNNTDSELSDGAAVFDWNTGFNLNYPSSYQSWMWKRGQGFDVVCYTGNGGSGSAGRRIRHSLGQQPQMIWIKHRGSSSYAWAVYHEGLNGGSNPEQKYLTLNENYAEGTLSNLWNDMAPSANDFVIGSNDIVNNGSQQFLALLFASVTGISKCGYYDGSDSGQTITTGFQPRFIIIKCTTDAFDWLVFDTVRGWASGNDQRLRLNDTSAQNGSYDVGAPTSTGFTLTNPGDGSEWDWNDAGKKYIYYAHA